MHENREISGASRSTQDRDRSINEERLGRRPDDTVATVIEDGKQSIYGDFQEHNATKRHWRVRVGRVRE
jgi:hypothetical protein